MWKSLYNAAASGSLLDNQESGSYEKSIKVLLDSVMLGLSSPPVVVGRKDDVSSNDNNSIVVSSLLSWTQHTLDALSATTDNDESRFCIVFCIQLFNKLSEENCKPKLQHPLLSKFLSIIKNNSESDSCATTISSFLLSRFQIEEYSDLILHDFLLLSLDSEVMLRTLHHIILNGNLHPMLEQKAVNLIQSIPSSSSSSSLLTTHVLVPFVKKKKEEHNKMLLNLLTKNLPLCCQVYHLYEDKSEFMKNLDFKNSIVNSLCSTSQERQKQALYVLKLSLSSEKDHDDDWLMFIQSYEVITFHFEKHLIDQTLESSLKYLTTKYYGVYNSSTFFSLNFTWIAILWQKLFNHENVAVKKMSLMSFMNNYLATTNELEFLYKILLPALNDNNLYKGGSTSTSFSSKLVKEFIASIAAVDNTTGNCRILSEIQLIMFGTKKTSHYIFTLFFESAASKLELNEDGLKVLRPMLTYVCQSFSSSLSERVWNTFFEMLLNIKDVENSNNSAITQESLAAVLVLLSAERKMEFKTRGDLFWKKNAQWFKKLLSNSSLKQHKAIVTFFSNDTIDEMMCSTDIDLKDSNLLHACLKEWNEKTTSVVVSKGVREYYCKLLNDSESGEDLAKYSFICSKIIGCCNTKIICKDSNSILTFDDVSILQYVYYTEQNDLKLVQRVLKNTKRVSQDLVFWKWKCFNKLCHINSKLLNDDTTVYYNEALVDLSTIGSNTAVYFLIIATLKNVEFTISQEFTSTLWTSLMDARKISTLISPVIALLLSKNGEVALIYDFFQKLWEFGTKSNREYVIYEITKGLVSLNEDSSSDQTTLETLVFNLCLYKEPLVKSLIQEKPSSIDDDDSIVVVQWMILSYLENVNNISLLTSLAHRFLEINATAAFIKKVVINNDVYVAKVRSWQALVVLCKRLSAKTCYDLVTYLFNKCIYHTINMPVIRYYAELFLISALESVESKEEVISTLILPEIMCSKTTHVVRNSLLIVLAKILTAPNNALVEAVASSFLCSSNGHTRVLVQYLIATHYEVESDDTAFLNSVKKSISTNPDIKRMLARQSAQIAALDDMDAITSVEGLTSLTELNSFNEYTPQSLEAEMKTWLSQAYRQSITTPATLPPSEKEEQPSSELVNVQRKILPWDSLLQEMQELSTSNSRSGVKKKITQNVIVVASLVEKVPNIAGLARTCEIFNAKKLVVSSKKLIVSDPAFLAISVSAEKWIDIEETHDTLAYLRDCKKDGYTIVGLEQTQESKCLSSFDFPKKIVIVLGKEKYGIPVEVLALVDVCIEIPQLGIIRSLNVHVSGSLILWEYTRQQMRKNLEFM